MTTEKEIIKFQIKGIEILDFELKYPQKQMPQATTFHYNVKVQQKINPGEKMCFVVVGVDVIHEDKKTILGNIRVSSIFHIENFNEIAKKGKDNKYFFHKQINDVLNSIAISTTRGVMFTCFRGTFLHSAILPVVDPKNMKPEDINPEV